MIYIEFLPQFKCPVFPKLICDLKSHMPLKYWIDPLCHFLSSAVWCGNSSHILRKAFGSTKSIAYGIVHLQYFLKCCYPWFYMLTDITSRFKVAFATNLEINIFVCFLGVVISFREAKRKSIILWLILIYITLALALYKAKMQRAPQFWELCNLLPSTLKVDHRPPKLLILCNIILPLTFLSKILAPLVHIGYKRPIIWPVISRDKDDFCLFFTCGKKVPYDDRFDVFFFLLVWPF